jgi:hypothetical protein
VDEVAPSGLGVATPQAMNSRRNNDHRKRDHDEKVALFQDFSRKIGQNQKSAIVSAQRNGLIVH